MRIHALALFALLLLLAPASPAKESPRSLLDNGSFESAVPAKRTEASGKETWKVGGDGKVPSGWTLNRAYPGTVTVLESGAASGKRCIQVKAGAAKDAHLYRPCATIRPGRWYRVSGRVRDGAASLLVYEYAAGGGPVTHNIVAGSGGPGSWEEFSGFYAVSTEKFKSASVALLVPKGSSAVLDDIRVEEMEGSPRDARSIRLKNEEFALEISAMGRLESLVSTGDGVNHANRGAPMPVFTAIRDGVRIPVGSVTKSGSTLTVRFADPAVFAKFRVTKRDGYFLFEVVAAGPADLEALELRFPLKPLRVVDGWMPGTHDDAFGIGHMAVTPNTRVRLTRHGSSMVLEAVWNRRHGIEGGKTALVAAGAPRFLETIRRMEIDNDLPSPMLPSGAPGETSSKDWVRNSAAVKRSYLFATYLGPRDLDAIIAHAKVGGFGLIMLHRLTWRATAGHETIARKAFPGGLPDLVKACEKIHAAGLRVGLHMFGPAVSVDDAYVTPVPDPRLFTIEVAPLHRRVDATATELTLRTRPDLPLSASPGVYPGDLLLIGNEIVRWRERIPGSPDRLVGCERGALGTKAVAHRAGEKVRSLVLRTGRILVDPDSTLPDEMGGHLARVVNAAGVDLVYFDGTGAAPEGRQPETWYYLNKVLLASCAQFDHGVLVQTSQGPGGQLLWHLVPRSASADGHGDLKGYLDQRMRGIHQMRRTFTAADIGWYALDLHGRPDELEYVCARALATGSNISVQANRPMLDRHPRAREVMEMIARWERRRLADTLPDAMRKRLLTPGRDFRLLEDGEKWSLWEAEYEADRPIPALDGKADRWTVQNETKQPLRLGLEIRREAIATTPALHEGEDTVPLIDLRDLSGFGNPEDPVLRKYAQVGDRIINADGLALRGVTTSLETATGVPGGGSGAVFSVDNRTNGAGWGTTGRRLAKPLDLSGAAALGLWVRGDGHGETLSLVLLDGVGKYATFRVALDFEGWRFKSFPRTGTIDWSRVEAVIFEVNHIPPNARVAAGFGEPRAAPTLHEPVPMKGLTITLGERTVRIPVSLEVDRCVTIDPLGRVVYWPGGMTEGRTIEVEGGPLLLPPGSLAIGIQVDAAEGYAGDLSVRVCRTWPLGK